MPDEFYCAECGRHIIRIISVPNGLALCAECIHVPGWFGDEQLRGMLDPELKTLRIAVVPPPGHSFVAYRDVPEAHQVGRGATPGEAARDLFEIEAAREIGGKIGDAFMAAEPDRPGWFWRALRAVFHFHFAGGTVPIKYPRHHILPGETLLTRKQADAFNKRTLNERRRPY